jgi:DNA-binding beta-propeller fold protein YncE
MYNVNSFCLLVFSGSTNSQLNMPRDAALDPNTRTLYISDCWNHRVMRYLPNASSGTVVAGGNGLGTSINQLNYPFGIHFDVTTNSLIIANYNSNNIVRWVLGDTSWTLVAGSSTGTSGNSSMLLNHPLDVVVDSMSNVYVADTDNHRIQFFRAGSLNGTTIAGIMGNPGASSTYLFKPSSLALDAQLNVYVADTFNMRIQKFLRV